MWRCRELYEIVIVAKVTYGVETWTKRMKKKHKLDMMGIKCLWSDKDGLMEK